MTRPIAGRMRWPTPPEPGTIVGTGWTREQLVALDTDDEGYTTLGYAQPAELAASLEREPRSAVEARTQRMKGRVEALDLNIFRRGWATWRTRQEPSGVRADQDDVVVD